MRPTKPTFYGFARRLLGPVTLLLAAACGSASPATPTKSADVQLLFDASLGDGQESDTLGNLDGTRSGDLVANCPGGAGCPCSENTDCEAGLCIDDPASTPAAPAPAPATASAPKATCADR